MRREILAAPLLAALAAASGCTTARAHYAADRAQHGHDFAGSPPVILWAWQRPNDLSFINPRSTGVSFLVETIRFGAGGMAVDRNSNSLRVPAGTWLMACARIEMPPGFVPTPSRDKAVASLVARLGRFPGAKAVQIDFDATVSQRAFYHSLLTELRLRLPASMPLSITALASWCEGDDWISALPVDEAVPMLFRMGADGRSILFRLQSGGDFAEPLCRKSEGISTDEFAPRLPSARRVYVFNPEGWTKASSAEFPVFGNSPAVPSSGKKAAELKNNSALLAVPPAGKKW
ncbi:MAG: DUF3142 domain-containing protein [Terriglobia bacterium]